MVYVFCDAESDENTFGGIGHILLELPNFKHKEIFYNIAISISWLVEVVLTPYFGQTCIFGR